jgi:hypothetical protein
MPGDVASSADSARLVTLQRYRNQI